MKRLVIIFSLLLTVMGATYAAEDTIKLDDMTPSIDAVISLPTDATGGVSVEMAGASLTLLDANGNVVLQVADERIHSIQFNLMPNSGDHTLRLERLPDVATAAVAIDSLSEFLLTPTAQQVNSNVISVDQSADVVLNSTTPNAVIDVTIPSDQIGLFAATTPNTATLNQLMDADGNVIATTMNGHVDSLAMLIDGGDYQYTMLGMNLTNEVLGNVRVSPYDITQNPILYVQQTEAVAVAAGNETTTVANTQANAGASCNASVFVSSVNLRSGPGTGYSVLDYGFQNDTFPVGGTNPTNNWIVVGLEGGNSAWMTRTAANLNGDCASLAVFDIPYREAQPAEVVIVTAQQQPSATVIQQQTYTEYEDDDDYEEYEDDDEYEEYEDDDDYEDYEEYEDYEDDDDDHYEHDDDEDDDDD